MVPRDPTAKAIHSLRDGSLVGRARTTVPTPATPATASASTCSRAALAITVRTPDHAAILAAAILVDMPPLPRADPAPPATASSSWSTSTISSISEAVVVEPRIGGEHAGACR